MKNIDNFLNNEFTISKTNLYYPVENPACSETFAQVALSNKSDVDLAVEYATKSLPRLVQINLKMQFTKKCNVAGKVRR